MWGRVSRADRRIANGYRAWCQLEGAAATGTREEGAWSAIQRLIDANPTRAWSLLVAVVRGVPAEDTRALVSLGADALEDLIRGHGADFIDALETNVRKDRRFAVAASAVWASDAPIWPRITRLLADLGEPKRG
jgi:hypothetical protein